MMERGYIHYLPAAASVSSFFQLLAYYSDLLDLPEPFASFFFPHQGQVLKEGFQSFAFQFFQAFPGEIRICYCSFRISNQMGLAGFGTKKKAQPLLVDTVCIDSSTIIAKHQKSL